MNNFRRFVFVSLAALSIAKAQAELPNVQPLTVYTPPVNTFRALASNLLNSRNNQLVSGEATPASKKPLLAGTSGTPYMHLSAQFHQNQMTKARTLQSRREVLSALGEQFTKQQTDVHIRGVNLAGDGQTATVHVEETVKFFYEKIRGDEPDYMGQHNNRTFFLARDDTGGWQVVKMSLDDRGGIPPINAVAVSNTPVLESRKLEKAKPALVEAGLSAAAKTSAVKMKSSDPLVGNKTVFVAASSYNYAAMRDYALRYWDKYNTSYFEYVLDCTNFISQALRAGGWTYANPYNYRTSSSGWWYYHVPGNFTSLEYNSYTWSGAQHWRAFALGSKRVYGLSSAAYLGIGDVVQIDYERDGRMDHTMIVTKTSSSQTSSGSGIYMTYHTHDTVNKSLSSIIASYPNAKFYCYRT